MTGDNDNIVRKKKATKALRLCIGQLRIPLIISALLTAALYFSDILASGILKGIELSVRTLIPSIFPFMILSEAAMHLIGDDTGIIGVGFEKVFGIRKRGALVYIAGVLCGYPGGISGTVRLRQAELISKREADILMPLCASPSLAFVTAGVGCGIFKNTRYGIILYLAILLGGIITGVFFRQADTETHFNSVIPKQKFNLSNTILDSGKRIAAVCIYLTAFCALIEVEGTLIKDPLTTGILAGLTEVSAGVTRIHGLAEVVGVRTALAMSAFALSLGGISVMMQANGPKGETDISILKFVKVKR